MKLLETYSKRLNVSESVYNKAHGGESLDNKRKITIATLLDNTNKFMNESFANSVGTQRADLGMWKKFCLNLTTVAIPNLIAQDLVIVHPMTSMSGYITYVKYTAGSNKGATTQGTVFNDPFRLGNVDVNYTSAKVVETATGTEFTPAWGPVVKDEAGKQYVEEEISGVWTKKELVDGKATVASGNRVRYEYDNVVIPQADLPIINASIESIALVAKARRVAVYYSQIAAFQA